MKRVLGESQGIAPNGTTKISNLIKFTITFGAVGGDFGRGGLFEALTGEVHARSVGEFGSRFPAEDGGFERGAGEVRRVAFAEGLEVCEEIRLAWGQGLSGGEGFLSGGGEEGTEGGEVQGFNKLLTVV